MGKKILTFFLLKSIANLITKLVSALLFPQILSALSSESVFLIHIWIKGEVGAVKPV